MSSRNILAGRDASSMLRVRGELAKRAPRASDRVICTARPRPKRKETRALNFSCAKKRISLSTVPSTAFGQSWCAGRFSGRLKRPIFTTRIPRIAMPRRMSMASMRSWRRTGPTTGGDAAVWGNAEIIVSLSRNRRCSSHISLAGLPPHRARGGTYSPFIRKESAASTEPSPMVTP